MSLKDRLAKDIGGIFFRETEFAQRHSYNGRLILCMLDGEDTQRKRSLNAASREWDAGMTALTLRIPASELSSLPMAGERITLDGTLYTIEAAEENLGEWILTLRSSEARTIV